MMSVFPLLHRETMSCSYFKDDILVLIFLSVVCEERGGKRHKDLLASFTHENIKSLHQLRSGKQLEYIWRQKSSQASSIVESSLALKKSQGGSNSTVVREPF